MREEREACVLVHATLTFPGDMIPKTRSQPWAQASPTTPSTTAVAAFVRSGLVQSALQYAAPSRLLGAPPMSSGPADGMGMGAVESGRRRPAARAQPRGPNLRTRGPNLRTSSANGMLDLNLLKSKKNKRLSQGMLDTFPQPPTHRDTFL